jgi:hypothetical protein
MAVLLWGVLSAWAPAWAPALAGLLTDVPAGGLRPGDLFTIAAATLLALLLAVRVAAGTGRPDDRPVSRRITALRRRACSAGVPRHRDPDAAGRSRPRAPAAHPSAA